MKATFLPPGINELAHRVH